MSIEWVDKEEADGATETHQFRSYERSRKSSRHAGLRGSSGVGSRVPVETHSISASGGLMTPHYDSIFHSAFGVSDDLKFTMSDRDGWLAFFHDAISRSRIYFALLKYPISLPGALLMFITTFNVKYL